MDKIDGAIALCFDCARQVGRAACMVTVEDSNDVLDQAIAQREEAAQACVDAMEERDAAEAAIETLRDLAGKIARTPPPPVQGLSWEKVGTQ